MIELSPITALMLYLCLTLLFLLGFWLFYHYKGKKRKFFPQAKQLHQCTYCHQIYLDETGKKITRCPECGSYN